MILNLGNLDDVNPLFTREAVEGELNSDRILNLMINKEWYVDEFSAWSPSSQWKTNFSTVAFRIDRCWVDDENNIWADVIVLDTVSGYMLSFDFPNNIRFLMKALHKPAKVGGKDNRILREESLTLIGFSYVKK